MNKQETRFVHHVFFWLKNPDSATDRSTLVAGLEKLSAAPTILTYQIALPAPTNRAVVERSWSVSWLCFFENLEAEESYQTDPMHLDFIENCQHLWQKVVVFDAEPAR